MAEVSPELMTFPSVDNWEVNQSNWSQTLDVLNHTEEKIRAQFSLSDNEDVPAVKLLCGGDLLESFAVPGLWKEEHVSEQAK